MGEAKNIYFTCLNFYYRGHLGTQKTFETKK